MSCQPCGCDPEFVGEQGYDQGHYGWVCEQHRKAGHVAPSHHDQVLYQKDMMKETLSDYYTREAREKEDERIAEVIYKGLLAREQAMRAIDLAPLDYEYEPVPRPTIRHFESGATRNVDTGKFDFEGFLNPEALHAFGEYMQSHRLQKDGSVRDSDNWQKGIPFATYIKSLLRHTFDLWRVHRGYVAINPDTGQPHTERELCSAITFNAMGYLKEVVDPSPINTRVK